MFYTNKTKFAFVGKLEKAKHSFQRMVNLFSHFLFFFERKTYFLFMSGSYGHGDQNWDECHFQILQM